ncbi:MAG: YceI family protein [Microscillaceae bacterium]|nr:YceI family protein [Microscillaceae bacterium]MDW8459593.1 YceI family protein [Cytophagales bacterium]
MKMGFSGLVISIFLVLTKFAFAQQKPMRVKSYTIAFKIKNFGFYVEGTLQGLESEIIFLPKELEKSSIIASVKTATINTNNSLRDNHLQKSDYFDAVKYPKISMKSKKVVALQNGSFIGYFDLTIKGKTKEVKVPFTYKENNQTATFQGNFTINRRDFGVGGSSIILGDEVVVNIKVETEL